MRIWRVPLPVRARRKKLFSITRKLSDFQSHAPKTVASVDIYPMKFRDKNEAEHR
jgi:hypothetical protein